MKRLLLSLLLIFGPAWAGSEGPEATVRAFQADYVRWNQAAVERDEKMGTLEAMRLTEAAYAELLAKYTLPGFKGEPIAYGDQPSHDPAREQVIETRLDGDSAIVRSQFKRDGYSPIYEYELVRSDGRWYLTQVYLVDSDGRYPGL